MRHAIVGLGSIVVLIAGCVTPEGAARARAIREFKCPESRVRLTLRPELSSGTYDVYACGDVARYTCTVYDSISHCSREPRDDAP